jgi:hypothetical protein
VNTPTGSPTPTATESDTPAATAANTAGGGPRSGTLAALTGLFGAALLARPGGERP